jgi:hypothetical protein
MTQKAIVLEKETVKNRRKQITSMQMYNYNLEKKGEKKIHVS